MGEEGIVLVLSCNSREVRGLFCKIANARGIPRRGMSRAAGRPCMGHTAGSRVLAHGLRRVGRAGEFVFLFNKELEIVF